MSKIHVLDPVVIDRIAAGEVVERPASVAKELVENALDAGATRIEVRLEDAGLGLVEVVDDGHGMDRDDAELAFAQHATSKVRTVEDLDAIATMGFRGEALASIAAVARVELQSGTGEGPGVRVRAGGGEVESVGEVAWPRGTTVRVEDLFFNTPARRKHLKTSATELRHVSRVVADYALCHPDRHFGLRHGKRELLAAPPVVTLTERVHQVFGAEVAEHWLPIEQTGAALRIRGGTTSPEHQRPNRNEIRWFVNERPVSDYRLVHALTTAYETLLDARRYPVAVVFLEMPVDAVDVNVHPRKAEVRFAKPGAVYGAVRTAVREALARHLPPPRLRAHVPTGPRAGGRPLPVEDWIVADSRPPHAADWVTERDEAGVAGAEGTAARVDAATLESARPAEGIRGTEGTIWPLAQYANTYIVAFDDKGLLIIDQHVAHERILYEQVLASLGERHVEAQHLLVPETIELSAEEAALIDSHRLLLESFGFELEPFGGRSWAIRTAPAMLDGRHLGVTVRSLLGSLADERGPEALDERRRELAASLACHAAVRANHPLTREEMVRLVTDLGRCTSPTRCPHGRPVLLRVEHDELERRIGRH